MNGFERLAIPLDKTDGKFHGWWIIEGGSRNISLNARECSVCAGALPFNWKVKPHTSVGNAPIQVVERSNQTVIRLMETRGYEWCVEEDHSPVALKICSSLAESRNWTVRQKNKSGNFKVVNHLGIADFSIHAEELKPLNLTFEFISPKFDFDSEYRRLTEDIANFCQQLLLSWEGPTRLRFDSNPAEQKKLLLEQFLFLRNFMTDERLNRTLEAISRNPHSRLVKEPRWIPAGAARSSDYLSDPMRLLRDWRILNGSKTPGEVCDIHKRDTHDTAPNRFIKFALSGFRQLSSDVCAYKWTEDGKLSAVGMEASEMVEQLDALLARPFFYEVGRMQRLPLDNQTLQKREGYREVLQAWLLTQAAASLNWEGEQDCYEGNTRDVATLYEYWIFIKLHELLRSMDGLETVESASDKDIGDFISETKGQLTINLKRGRQSFSRFVWKGPKTALHIELHYERSFSYDEGVNRSGSYSRRFRPDYTLSIYPASYKSEAKAEVDGKVSHLHFDAKYRAEDIAKVFGETEISDEEIAAEKLESKAERTYKRGDLLKMHTYNDALRHTIGSYVLYPGTKSNESERLHKFHEIAPGVGAMVMKPGNADCLDTIKCFLNDVFEHQSEMFSQYRYLSDTSYRIHHDKPEALAENGSTYSIARMDAPCVVLCLRKEDEATYRENGFAYCRAISEEHKRTLNLNLSIEVGSEFIPCGGEPEAPKTGYGWRAKVCSARFIARDKLTEYIDERGLSPKLNLGSADHYLLFEFDDATEFKKIDLSEIYRRHQSGTDHMAVTCKWSDILSSTASPALSL